MKGELFLFGDNKQQGWWFETQPEYNQDSNRARSFEEIREITPTKKVRPEEVDAYVYNALQYVDEPVAELLKSVKRNFGTEGESWKGAPNRALTSTSMKSGGVRVSPTDHFGSNADHDSQKFSTRQNTRWPQPYRISQLQYKNQRPDGGAFMPRLPTPEELYHWSKDTAKGLRRWVDSTLQKSPLLVNPNDKERHHGLPRKRKKYFIDANLDIEDYIIIITAAKHRLKPKGLHTGKGRGGDWNTEWDEFIKKHPVETTPDVKERIEEKLEEMKKKYGIE